MANDMSLGLAVFGVLTIDVAGHQTLFAKQARSLLSYGLTLLTVQCKFFHNSVVLL